MAGQTHRSAPEVLNRRTVERDHPRLAARLRPGMAVLDVGCGTGAITAGIARLVGPEGFVLGIDRDESLLAIARSEHGSAANLEFQAADVLAFEAPRRFDIAAAARVLQWLAQPGHAIARIAGVLREGGELIALDYNHRANSWDPPPPSAFSRFYGAFLAWREANGWDNAMAEHLPGLFRDAGLQGVESFLDDELVQRGEPAFEPAANIWGHLAATVGPAVVQAGFLTESERIAAAVAWHEFAAAGLRRQMLVMRTVMGMFTSRSDT
jgi:SAM-dependent methyltransferase